MPSTPPFSRSEKIADYARECRPVVWEEHSIRSIDGIKVKLLEGEITVQRDATSDGRHVIVVYFQGNGSSLPPRLPCLSNIIKRLYQESDTHYTFVALSYRGFWTSKGRPSQKGIELDAQATLEWVAERYNHIRDKKVVVFGQSIGAGVATTAVATWLDTSQANDRRRGMKISALLLETPFTSLRTLLVALYPQKFLPYRYLGPFLWSTWDSDTSLRYIGKTLDQELLENDRGSNEDTKMKILLLEAGNDELVPEGEALRLRKVCQQFPSLLVDHKIVSGALHTNVTMKPDGKKNIVQFLRNV